MILLSIAAGFLLLTIGCSDDDDVTEPAATPPDLPPQSGFIMDFSNFADAGSLATPQVCLDADTSMLNWGQSVVRISFWNLALVVTLAVPTAAFVEAFNHEPVQQEDDSWEWTYSVTVGVPHTCRLVGRTENTQTHWEMYITKEGEYSDYLWYSGYHNLPLTEGVWTVNRHPDQSNPFLEIDWHRDPVTNTGDLKYTNIVPDAPENGSYIFYGSDTAADYDRFYHLYNVEEDNLAEIEWHHQDKNGRVKDEFFYGDSDWHCWDANLRDAACP
jgi:hypothetical protein